MFAFRGFRYELFDNDMEIASRLLPPMSEQVAVRPYMQKLEHKLVFDDPVYQEPVRFYMTLPHAFVIA